MIPGAPLNKFGSASTDDYIFLMDNPRHYEVSTSTKYYGHTLYETTNNATYSNNCPCLYVLKKSDIGSDLGKFRRDFTNHELKTVLDLPFRTRAIMHDESGWNRRNGAAQLYSGLTSEQINHTLNPGWDLYSNNERIIGELNTNLFNWKDLMNNPVYGQLSTPSGPGIVVFPMDSVKSTGDKNPTMVIMSVNSTHISIHITYHSVTLHIHDYPGITEVFIGYVARVKMTGVSRLIGINKPSESAFTYLSNIDSYSISNYQPSEGIISYSIPMITKYTYSKSSGSLTLNGVVNPTLNTDRFNSTPSAACSVNYKVIPTVNVLDDTMGSTTHTDGNWSLPANNYCLSVMVKDSNYYSPGHRLLFVTGYDPEVTLSNDFSINESTIFISAVDTSDSDTFNTTTAPTEGPVVISIKDMMKVYNPPFISKLKNMCKIACVRWDDNYIIGVTYGNMEEDRIRYFTVIFSIDATVSLDTNPSPNYITIINGAFTDFTVVS